MAERIGYAVYSEFERGYLVNTSPSIYLWDPSAAILYETPAKAWASANRRESGYAVAVAIVREGDGSLQHEELAIPMRAKPGTWIVTLLSPTSFKQPHYITTVNRDGKGYKLSIARHDARGFSHEQAKELAASLQGKKGINASIELMVEEDA
ncbi:hypothetical protein [Pseudaeromonas paramecii]|uniref:Uncharacterized protein n=1 Tax=Pseudaeromonas paramecii TaxID=2138166 RepID=A0ABP8PYJ1_9GAMM